MVQDTEAVGDVQNKIFGLFFFSFFFHAIIAKQYLQLYKILYTIQYLE